MEPNTHILPTHSNRCYLLYKNFLVFNLPQDKIDACVSNLDKGKLYNKYAAFFVKTFIQGLKTFTREDVYNRNKWDDKNAPTLTLVINDKFNIRCYLKQKRIVITDGRETVRSRHPKVFAWLCEHLAPMGYETHTVNDSKEIICLKKGLYDTWLRSVE